MRYRRPTFGDLFQDFGKSLDKFNYTLCIYLGEKKYLKCFPTENNYIVSIHSICSSNVPFQNRAMSHVEFMGQGSLYPRLVVTPALLACALGVRRQTLQVTRG